MPRIRTIKPEFWTSETIAALPLAARLTFIALWTYVDDNGVGVWNDRLIASSVYPMDDPRESVAIIRDSLATFLAKGLVVLYETSGKRLLYIAAWDEHQRVDKPRKPRYPRPAECDHDPVPPPPTSINGVIRGDVGNDSGSSRDDVAEDSQNPRKNLPRNREQGTGKGAGNREQGASRALGARSPRTGVRATPAPRLVDASAASATAHTARSHALVERHAASRAHRPPASIRRQLARHVDELAALGWPDELIGRCLAAWSDKGLDPAVFPSVANEIANRAPATAPPSTADQRTRAGLELAAKYARLDGDEDTLAALLTGNLAASDADDAPPMLRRIDAAGTAS